jgi:hypothetical protein
MKLPNHEPDNFYPLSEINKAAKHVPHGVLHTSFLQPNIISTLSLVLLTSISIKTEDLSTFFEQFAQTLVMAMGS